jgi:hypothetical protein
LPIDVVHTVPIQPDQHGEVTVSRALMRRRRDAARLFVLALLAAPAIPLGGCSSFLSEGTADAAGLAGAGIAGAVSSNPTVGAAVGFGVASGARAGPLYAERRVSAAEQDRIAEAAGPLAPGQVAAWNGNGGGPAALRTVDEEGIRAPFVADGGGRPVAAQHADVVAKRQDLVVDRGH